MPFELMLPFETVLSERRILITGHSGFTGAWVSFWLKSIGAKIAGLSLPPETSPALYSEIGLYEAIPSVWGDICDYALVEKTFKKFHPEIILHLAAQPLVRRSYREPIRTFAVNTLGTAHILEAARKVKSVQAILCITTDKVYQNKEWPWPYRENDPLGGKDPYSASKAAAEMIIQSYSRSFPWSEGRGPVIATVRGGNIIGGGDWSEDRLIPDFVRAVTNDTTLTLRYPEATRPWQHVLALVQGYMMLMSGLVSEEPSIYAREWNMGPQDPKQHTVRHVLEMMSLHWQRPHLKYMDNPLPEASTLALDSSIARNLLGWIPPWSTERAIEATALWYREYYRGVSTPVEITFKQLQAWRQELFK